MIVQSEPIQYTAAGELKERVLRLLLAVGVRADVAEPTADGLVWTSLRGIDSHGVRLLPHYVAGVEGGRLNPDPSMKFERTGPGTGRLEADHTFGHAAGVKAMEHAVDLADDAGIGAVTVSNSSHCGAISYFAHAPAARDMIGMAFTHATPRVMTPGSTRPFFGNNPICLVAPMRDEGPFCFDAATTGITFNAVRAHAAAGEILPPGLVADAAGRETTDPQLARQLLPIGDYKGFGLSMMVDVLCAVLTGMPSGDHVTQMFGNSMGRKRYLGQLYCAIRIDAFRDPETFKADLQELANRVRAEPPAEPGGAHPMVPGDPEKRAYDERSRDGIPLPDALVADFVILERRLLQGEPHSG